MSINQCSVSQMGSEDVDFYNWIKIDKGSSYTNFSDTSYNRYF
jgi:hypothetical protein